MVAVGAMNGRKNAMNGGDKACGALKHGLRRGEVRPAAHCIQTGSRGEQPIGRGNPGHRIEYLRWLRG